MSSPGIEAGLSLKHGFKKCCSSWWLLPTEVGFRGCLLCFLRMLRFGFGFAMELKWKGLQGWQWGNTTTPKWLRSSQFLKLFVRMREGGGWGRVLCFQSRFAVRQTRCQWKAKFHLALETVHSSDCFSPCELATFQPFWFNCKRFIANPAIPPFHPFVIQEDRKDPNSTLFPKRLCHCSGKQATSRNTTLACKKTTDPQHEKENGNPKPL